MPVFVHLPGISSGWAHANYSSHVLFGLATPLTPAAFLSSLLSSMPRPHLLSQGTGNSNTHRTPFQCTQRSCHAGSPLLGSRAQGSTREGPLLQTCSASDWLGMNLSKWLFVNQLLEFYRLLKIIFLIL